MLLTTNDFLIGIGCFVVIGMITFLIETCIRKKYISQFFGRKLLHSFAIFVCAIAIYNFTNIHFLSIVFLVSAVLLLFILQKGWLFVQDGSSYGIALFPLSFFVLLQLPFLNKSQIVFSVLVLGISDAIGGLVGKYFSKQKIIFLYEEKSLLGCFTFFICTAIIYALLHSSFSFHSLLLISCISIVPALTELFSYKGSDNLSVPICTAIWVYFIEQLSNVQIQNLSIIILVLVILSIATIYKKWLSISGACAALFTGCFLMVAGGWQSFIAPAFLLVSGSVLSKLNASKKTREIRDAKQVFCNGIIGVLAIIVFAISKQPIFFVASLLSYCISTTDSISSEAGKLFKGKTIDIIGFKPIAMGLSGGISWQGSVLGLLAACCIGASSSYLFQLTTNQTLIIVVGGFMGMLVDSIIGSTIQAKYSFLHTIVEEEKPNALLVKGYSWCTNNHVNMISNCIVVTAYILFVFLLN